MRRKWKRGALLFLRALSTDGSQRGTSPVGKIYHLKTRAEPAPRGYRLVLPCDRPRWRPLAKSEYGRSYGL